jgi:hypothetical protein
MSKTAIKTDYDEYIHEPNNNDLDHIPGDYGLPFIGKTIEFSQDPYGLCHRMYEEHGPVFKMSFGGSRCIVAMGPDLIQKVMLDPDRNFSSKMGFMDRVTTFFDGSLIM